MTPAEATNEDLVLIRSCCQLVVKHGLTRLTFGELTIERPQALAFQDAAAKLERKQPSTDPEDDDLARLRAMTPEQQDAALTLAPTRET